MSSSVVLALCVIGYVLGYAAACRWWPFKACRKCNGEGKLRSPSGKAWRKCTRCKGTGARLRTGRRISNYLTRTIEPR